MPIMPGLTARPWVMRQRDAWMNGNMEQRRQYVLRLLKGDSISKIYEHVGIGETHDWKHLDVEFFGDDRAQGAYWPDDQWGYRGDKQEISRQGFIEAVRIANGLTRADMTIANFNDPVPPDPVTKPIETIWVCVGDHWELTINDGENQVTILMQTPPLPPLPDDRKPILSEDGAMWSIGHHDVLQSYIDQYRSDNPRLPTLDPPYDVPGKDKPNKVIRLLNKFDEPPRT